MDRYKRVEKPREETPFKEDEIRITAQGRMRGYITYACSLIEEKGLNKIVFKAMGRAINKTVLIVELLKKRIVGLHQNTAIGSTDLTDVWEPLEEGLLPLETIRHVSMITITLSKQELDMSSVGYQTPLGADQVKRDAEYEDGGERYPAGRGRGRGNRSRGRGRGRGRENGPVIVDYANGGGDNRSHGFGKGGSGRGFSGRGNGRFDHQHEANGYLDEPHAPSKGRGRRRKGRDARSNGPINAGAANA